MFNLIAGHDEQLSDRACATLCDCVPKQACAAHTAPPNFGHGGQHTGHTGHHQPHPHRAHASWDHR